MTDGTYIWEDGTAFSNTTFSNWGPAQPNNYHNQDCLDLYYDKGEWVWNDENCDAKLKSLCEIN